MLDSIYHMTLKLLSNLIFGIKTLGFCHICVTLLKGVPKKWFILILMHDIISLSEAMKYDKMAFVAGLHFKCQHLNNFLVSMI